MTEEFSITIEIENMLIGDLELLDKADTGDLSTTELVDFLDRVVEEDVRLIPLVQLPNIVNKLGEAVQSATNPEAPEGN